MEAVGFSALLVCMCQTRQYHSDFHSHQWSEKCHVSVFW